jgi:hypothetical protein
MKTYLFFVILFQAIYFSSFSQNITGKVYDSESTVKGIKVFNKTKNIYVFTNDSGDFSINATVNDTLTFSSLFYKEKSLKIVPKDLNNTLVIELKKNINNLDEVLLTNNGKEKPFDKNKYSDNLSEQIKNDIKNNPHLYGVMPTGGIDFVKLASLISKLFKKKNKKQHIIYASYKDLDSLFKSKNIFDDKLLATDLKIKIEYKSLFFDFCESKNINKNLLSQKNELDLLDKLFEYSKEFNLIMEEYTNKQ